MTRPLLLSRLGGLLVLMVTLSISNSSYAQPMWAQTNGPASTAVHSLMMDGSGRLYVATDRLLRSSDQGAHWSDLTPDGMTSVTSVAITGSGKIFVASQSSPSFMSSDDGHSWTSVATPDSILPPLAVVFASQDGDVYGVNTGRYDSVFVYHSHDDGITWETSSLTQSMRPYNSCGFIAKSRTAFVFGESDCYRTTNKGRTWQKIVNGLRGDQFAMMSEGAEGRLYFVGRSTFSTSTDDGRSWTNVAPFSNVIRAACAESGGVLGFTNNEYLASFAYSTNRKDFVPLTNGLSFAAAKQTLTPGSHIIADGLGGFYASYGELLYHLAGVGSEWQYIPTPSSYIASLVSTASGAVIASVDNRAGTDGSASSEKVSVAINSTLDGGNTWSLDFSAQATTALALDSNHDVIAAGGSLSRLSSGVWTRLGTLSSSFGAVDVAATGEIFVGSKTEGMFRSTDNGNTWDQFNEGLTDAHVTAVAVHPQGNVYAGTLSGIYVSHDNGISWTLTGIGLPNAPSITAMVVNNQGHIVAAVNAKGSFGVYWSLDLGNTWIPIGTGLPKVNVHALLTTPIGHVFAATDDGIYYLPLAGGAWVDASAGLKNRKITALARDQSGVVYAGTAGSGVWKSLQTYNIAQSADVKRVSTNATSLAIEAVYPNPAQASSNIRFSVARAAQCRVELVNMLGERVTLLDANVGSGSYTMPLKLAGFAAGAYQLRVITAETQASKTIMIAP